MSITELQKFTYVSKYAKWNKPTKKRETWDECVDTVRDMHKRKYPQIADEIDEAFEFVRKKKVLPSQRTLQFGGAPIERHNLRGYNCSYSPCDRPRFFQETMYALLCGTGVGFSVQKHHIDKLPSFDNNRINNRNTQGLLVTHFDIPDTIEGWADSVGFLINSFYTNDTHVTFNFDNIRPKGSLLSSGTGRAPGPEPLKKALYEIERVLNRCIQLGYNKLRPIDAYDIVMHIADAVLSGGVRRSSCIALFSLDDEEMLKSKTGNWAYDNPHRARSNNSVVLLRDHVTYEQFYKLIESIKEFGEPGFAWVDDLEQGTNPCISGDTRIHTDKGILTALELYNSNDNNIITTDNRVVKDGQLNKSIKYGINYNKATKVYKTGIDQQLYKITTSHGYQFRVTSNHRFPTKDGIKRLDQLDIGQEILLQSDEGQFGTFGTFEQGLLLGIWTGDGTSVKKNKLAYIDIWEDDFDIIENIQNLVHMEIKEYAPTGKRKIYPMNFGKCSKVGNSDKQRIGGSRLYKLLENIAGSPLDDIKQKVPNNIWRGSREFIVGYLQGILFSDGSIQCQDRGSKTCLNARISQSNKKILQDIQILLSNFGVVSRLYLRSKAGYKTLPDSQRNPKQYLCKTAYELIINKPNLINYYNKIGIYGRKNKLAQKYLQIHTRNCRKPERYITKILSIEKDGIEDVYCLSQPATQSMIINGCVTLQCYEIGLYGYDEHGNSGFQMCNLTTINGKKCKTVEDFLEACRIASFIGTLQAGYTSFPYLGEISEKITQREALLGVSICGIMEKSNLLLNPENQKLGAQAVIVENERVAKLIGINPAARCTAIKPDGTTALLLGSSSGIHPHHARRYIRRVKCNQLEAPYQYFKTFNIHAIEKDYCSANGTDDFIMFPIEIPDGAKLKNEVSALELLKCVRDTYINWINYGKCIDRCVKPWLSHNVSNTVTVKQDEWEDVAKFIYDNRHCLCGVSLLSYFGDKDYIQAPFTTVFTPAEIVKTYGEASIFASGIIERALEAFDNNLWLACDVIQGMGNIDCDDKQKAWILKAQQFTQRYFSNDIKVMTYCLKDVYNWKLYTDLKRDFSEVNYDNMIEEQDTIDHINILACSGPNGCEI